MAWTIELLDRRVERELSALPLDLRRSFYEISEAIERFGFSDDIPPQFVKHLEGKLWEMRLRGRDGIARAVYVTAKPQRVVVLHVFEKKTQKTPRAALEIARQRMKELK